MIESALERFGTVEISKLPHEQSYWVNLYNNGMSTPGKTIHGAITEAMKGNGE